MRLVIPGVADEDVLKVEDAVACCFYVGKDQHNDLCFGQVH